jgi:dTMP kinase
VSSNSQRGKFITFEGLDGTGKSTQIEKLAKALRARGLSVLMTREPGGTATGEKIRHVILDSATTQLSFMAEMALMFASRAQHIEEVIHPGSCRGQNRLATLHRLTEAYQGAGRKLGSDPVLELHRILCDLQPDLTAYGLRHRQQRRPRGAATRRRPRTDARVKTKTASRRKIVRSSPAFATATSPSPVASPSE